MAMLYGTSGADLLQGTAAADTLAGGMGADTFVFIPGSGADVVLNEGAWSLDDVLWLSQSRLQDISAGFSGDDLQIVLQDGSRVTLAEWGSSSGRLRRFQLQDGLFFFGGDGSADWLQGGDSTCYLYGMGGNDTVVGGAGADYLEGGSGADMLWGGGAAGDLMSGGSGSDIFFFGSGDGSDTVTDAAAGDAVWLYDLQTDAVQATQVGLDLRLTTSNGAQLTLQNAYNAALQGQLYFGFADGSVHTLTSSGWSGSSQGGTSSSSFSIRFDYRFDSSGFFRDHPERQAILDQAGLEWSRHIADEFADVPAGTVVDVSNPVTGGDERFSLTDPIDDVLIFVGAANIDNPAYGGPSAYYTVGSSLDQRWNSTTNFEPWVGSITFDTSPTYSNGSSLDWFFDPTPSDASDVASAGAGKEDLLTVAIHEIGHVLGIVGGGTVNAFDRWVSGSYFTGPAAKAANQGRSVLLIDDTHPDGYRGGFNQEVVMAYGGYSSVGHRVTPSSIDLGMLSDIGYQIR